MMSSAAGAAAVVRPFSDGCGRRRPRRRRPYSRWLVDEVNPLAGQPLYVDPNSAVMRAARSADPPSPQLDAIADTPQAWWIDQAFSPSAVVGRVAGYAGAAQAAEAMAGTSIPPSGVMSRC